MSDRLAELERRGDELEVFAQCERDARAWVAKHGSGALVAELREARAGRRRVKVGTPNTLVLLMHIDDLERKAAEPVLPIVAGRCPSGCGETLFLGAGGHVTCAFRGCPDPAAASALLASCTP